MNLSPKINTYGVAVLLCIFAFSVASASLLHYFFLFYVLGRGELFISKRLRGLGIGVPTPNLLLNT